MTYKINNIINQPPSQGRLSSFKAALEMRLAINLYIFMAKKLFPYFQLRKPLFELLHTVSILINDKNIFCDCW